MDWTEPIPDDAARPFCRNQPMIYLASPYSHPDPEVRHRRFVAACRAAARLMAEGKPVFSPIAHSHPIAEHGGLCPTDCEMWLRLDLPFLAACSELCVLTLNGWTDSRGVAAEIIAARDRGIPITFVAPEERA